MDHNLITQRTWDETEIVCGFYNRISFYQPYVEEAMDLGARRHGAEINQGWEIVKLGADADHVTVVAREHAGVGEPALLDPAERTITAAYVIGADGARSMVREALDTEWRYFDYRDAWLSVDVLRKKPLQRFDPTISTQIISPEQVVALVPIGKERIRFEFLLGGEPEDHVDLSEEAGYAFLDEAWGLGRDDVEIYRQVVYPFEGRMVRDWSKGRVFLAGDAAHLMPPFVGMGAVSAFRDAANLSWKLDLVLRGVSSPELLQSYQVEREPHTQTFIELGVAIGQMCTISDPAAAAARDAAMRNGGTEHPPDPEYDAGILLMRDDQVQRPAGLREPQGVVRRGEVRGRFDDVVGPWGFSLVIRDVDPRRHLSGEQLSALEAIGCKLVTISADPGSTEWVEQDDLYERFFAEHGIVGYLSRPDFRVFAGIERPEQISSAVDALLGQLSLKELTSAA
ncbi:MAG TPA: FAD-dependent monooxygenase [Acidimicrobiales bacterium]|nr:FAD-dependent monooxygenase [Acidimicrobiales bacterium]